MFLKNVITWFFSFFEVHILVFSNIFIEVLNQDFVNFFSEVCQKLHPNVQVKVFEEYIAETLKYAPHRDSKVSNIQELWHVFLILITFSILWDTNI